MLSDLFFGAQGVFLLGNGMYLLLFPEKAATDTGSPLLGCPIPVVRAMRYAMYDKVDFYQLTFTTSMSSFSIGALFLQAVYQHNQAVMALSIVGRILAVVVFWWLNGGPWKNVAIFEGVMGLLTGLSLIL